MANKLSTLLPHATREALAANHETINHPVVGSMQSVAGTHIQLNISQPEEVDDESEGVADEDENDENDENDEGDEGDEDNESETLEDEYGEDSEDEETQIRDRKEMLDTGSFWLFNACLP